MFMNFYIKQGSEDAEKHALYVWENFIEREAKAKHIAIVAHSYGGIVTVELVGFCFRSKLSRGHSACWWLDVDYVEDNR